jgi:lipid A 3-O-deacylase
VIGPWSLAEQSQDLVHDLRGIERFRGWDHQLHNEPAFQMALERKFKSYAIGAVQPGWSSDVIGSYAIASWQYRNGRQHGPRAAHGLEHSERLRQLSDPPRRRESTAIGSVAGFAQRRISRAQRLGAHDPARMPSLNLEAKAVAWDFSLDGNLFRHSHHVNRRPMGGVQAAARHQQPMACRRAWHAARSDARVAYPRVRRTAIGRHAFGSIALSIEF